MSCPPSPQTEHESADWVIRTKLNAKTSLFSLSTPTQCLRNLSETTNYGRGVLPPNFVSTILQVWFFTLLRKILLKKVQKKLGFRPLSSFWINTPNLHILISPSQKGSILKKQARQTFSLTANLGQVSVFYWVDGGGRIQYNAKSGQYCSNEKPL